MVQPRLLRQSDRVSVPPVRYGWDEDKVSFALVTEAGDPGTYKETIKVDDSDKWVIAMEHEIVFGKRSNMRLSESTKGF